jgi:hypothetical protein
MEIDILKLNKQGTYKNQTISSTDSRLTSQTLEIAQKTRE